MNQHSEWRVTDMRAESNLTVLVDHPNRPAACPRCGSTKPPRRSGALDTSFRDVPFLGMRVTITVNAQRFRCGDCGQAFFQEFPDMDGKRRISSRCAVYVIEQVMARSSIREVAEVIGIDDKGVRNVLHDRGMVFTAGHLTHEDHLVCECCLGLHPKIEIQLAPTKHFGRWRREVLRKEVNACRSCIAFAEDPWRAGMVRRLL